MKTLSIAALAVSTLALATPASALTPPSTPIDIQQVLSSPSNPESSVPTVVEISYANENTSAVHEVTFRLIDAEGREAEVEDVGSFAKGVSIRHEFHIRYFGDAITAQVLHVEFADGSTWDAGAAADQSRRQTP